MSIFNVGTGREPAEIGVAEYQKPDYQQFDKLANINMAMKQQELEKAQKKTKEWGDILNTDFSTKYAVEQAQYVKKNIDAIKSNLIEDYKKDDSILNDPTYMMQVKARLNQVKGFVKTLDEQAEQIAKDKIEYEKDTKGISYDKQYGKDYFNALDNPIEFAKNNPDSEVGKFINTIATNPSVQNLDTDDQRFVVRQALINKPKKQGYIATDISYKGKDLGFDIYDAESNTRGSNRYSRVSEVSAINQAMNYALQSSDSNANKSFAQIVGDKLEQQYGSNLDAYKQQLKAEYTDKYNKFKEQYKGDGYELPRETLNSMKSPDELTDNDLFAFEYSKQTAPALMKKAEMSTTKNIVNVSTGNGKASDFNANSTSNQVHTIPTVGNTRALQTSLTYTGSGASGINFSFPLAMGTDSNGKMYINTSGGGANSYSANINDTRQELTYSWKNQYIQLGGGRKIEKPLSEAEINKIEADAAKGIYNPNVVGKIAFVAKGKGSVGSENYNIYTYAEEAPEAFDKYNEYLRQAGGNRFIPDKKEYSLKETYELMQQYGATKSTPKRTIKR